MKELTKKRIEANRDISQFLGLCIESASNAYANDARLYIEELGLGYRAYSSYMRKGVKAVIDMQGYVDNLCDRVSYLESQVEEYSEFFGDVLESEDVTYLEEEDRQKIGKFIDDLIKAKDKELEAEDCTDE